MRQGSVSALAFVLAAISDTAVAQALMQSDRAGNAPLSALGPDDDARTSTGAAEPQPQAGGVGDIVVTAQRRSENLQKVPIAVQVVTQETLRANGVINLASLPTVVPGVSIQRVYSGASPFIRGIGAATSGFTVELPVATYVDGIYLPNTASAIFAFNNIERIELLKGPQGTLFGRNAVGGLINIVTKDPSHTPGLEARIGYGNYKRFEADLYATTGLTDDLAIDLAALYRNQGKGWGRNPFDGRELFKEDEFNVSSKMKWTPGDTTTVTIRGLYSESKGDIGVVFGVYPGSVGTDGTSFVDTYDIASRIRPFNEREQINFSAKIEQEIGALTLVSLTGYNYATSDVAGVNNGILGNVIPGQSAINLRNDAKGRTFTQELQLQSSSTGSLRWIAGAFFMRDHFTLVSDITPTCIGVACAPVPPPVRTFGDQVLKSYAVFGEATYEAISGTRLTVGLRYTKDDKDLSAAFRQPLPGFSTSVQALPPPNRFGDIGAPPPTASFDKLTWRGVIAHDFTPEIMGYVSANRGFKAGAYNPTSFINPVVRPEVLDAYEVGLKTRLFDRLLRLNLAAFYYDYKDIQLRSLAPPAPPGQTLLFNAANARVRGVDGDFVLAPSARLTINGAFSYLDAKFTDFPGGVCTVPLPIAGSVRGGARSFTCDLQGFRLPRAPKFSGNLGINYRVPTRVGDIALFVSDAYNDGFYWEVDNRLQQESYHQLNASITWTSPDDRFSLQVYGNNLNNPKFFYAASEASGGTDIYTPAEPRTYGVRLGIKL